MTKKLSNMGRAFRTRGAALTGSVLGLALAAGMTLSASAATGPVISGVTAYPTVTGASIQWMTDTGANAQVLYGTSTPYAASTTPTTGYASTSQSVMLSGLAPDTVYHYSVLSGNASGTVSTSTDYTFTTSPSTGSLGVNPTSGTPGSSFTVTGYGFWQSEPVSIAFNGATTTVNADASGTITAALTAPSATVSMNVPMTVTARGNVSGMTATTDFTVTPASTTPTSTATYAPSITLSPTGAMAGSSFTVNGTGFAPNEAVTLTFNGTPTTVNADTHGNLMTTLTVPSGMASGSVFVTAMGATSATSTGAWFSVQPSNSTSTDALANEISQLQVLINKLAQEVQSFLAGLGTGTTTGGGTGIGTSGNGNGSGSGYPPTNLSATIDQMGPIRAGTSVDFTGRNWGTNEQVQVYDGSGQLVATAQADGGGNFSTGSLPVTNATGTQTYTFKGVTTGITRTATITIVP